MSKEECHPPTMETIAGGPNGHRHIRIQRQITETVDVVVVDVECGICTTPAPLPDAHAMAVLLDHAEDMRLVWGREEDANHERASYPLKGWRRVSDYLLCPKCYKEFRQYVLSKRAASMRGVDGSTERSST